MTSPRSTLGEPEQIAEGEVRKLKRRFLEVEEVRLHVVVFLDHGSG
jgi:hypothetical protein